MNYLVTGGSGFVGGYVVRNLRRAGHRVAVLDLSPNRDFLHDLLGADDLQRVQLLAGDVTDLPLLLRTMQTVRPQRVVHLAATLSSSSAGNPLRALRVNCEGTLNMFEASLAMQVEKVVWASSIAVFGPSSRRPEDEVPNDARHRPYDLYGACKSLNEQFARHYRRHRQLDCTGLRFSVVYGYGKALTMARGTGADFLPELIDKPAIGEAGVVAHGDALIDWLYVEDAARAVVLASQTPHTHSVALNICGARASIRAAAAGVKTLLPDAELEVQGGTWGGAMRFAMASAEAEIGYSPQVSLQQGLRLNINAIRAKHGLSAV